MQWVSFYDPVANVLGVVTSNISPHAMYKFPDPIMVPLNSSLVNAAEFVIGGDSISDLAAVQEGLNPFGNYPLYTGVFASAALQGQAQAVALAGSTLARRPRRRTSPPVPPAWPSSMHPSSRTRWFSAKSSSPGNSTDVSVDNNLMIAAVASNGAA